MTVLQPVLLGTETGAYAMARAYHERYGVTSLMYGRYQMSASKFSSIVRPTLFSDLTEPEAFVRHMTAEGKRLNAQSPGTTFLLTAHGDDYSRLLSRYQDALSPYFSFATIDFNLHARLSDKASFYQLCKRYGLDYPVTHVVTPEDVENFLATADSLPYPVIVKASDSVEYLSIDFPGRKKVFIANTTDELKSIIYAMYGHGYASEIIVQEFIPGGDDEMYVLNAYVDRNHHVRSMILGRALAGNPDPNLIGNYSVLVPAELPDAVAQKYTAFLEKIGYHGLANIDLKRDPRTGRFMTFEINLRPGRTNYFLTANGINVAECFVDDLVLQTPSAHRVRILTGSRMLCEIPKKTTQIAAQAHQEEIAQRFRSGAVSSLRYSADLSLKRRLLLLKLDKQAAASFKANA